MAKYSEEEFFKLALDRFGSDMMQWKFVCPSCGHIQSVQDYKDAGAPETAVGFSCVGRWLAKKIDAFPKQKSGGPCNYAGGGLFRIAPIEIEGREGRFFDLAPKEQRNVS